MTAAVDAAPRIRPLDYPEPQYDNGPTGPNDRQLLAHHLSPHADELLYGGARGGGKTDLLLAEFMTRLHLVPGMQAVIFRRTYKELSGPGGIIPRLLTRIPRSVGRYNSTDHVWRFTNGSTLTLSYLERLGDVQAWLGLELQLMGFDQLEQLEEETYVMVRTSLRVAGELATKMAAAGLRPSAIATANPGGIGHAWVKERFIDPFPLGGQLFRASPTEAEPLPSVRCFVPAKLSDNPALEIGDPGYRRRLEGLPAPERAAQLEGDWNVFKGARFSTFRTEIHVRELTLPEGGGVARGCGIDYGSDSPFVALWGALLADDLLYIYREVAERGLSPREQALLVLASEAPGERNHARPLPTALDPSCWAASPDKPLKRTGGKAVRPSGPPEGSIADSYRKAGLAVRQADNRRIDGWTRLDARLKVRPDGFPRLIIHPSCTELIRTLPAQQRDPKNPEDVIKGSTDHWADALRYLEMLLAGMAPPAEPIPTRPLTHAETRRAAPSAALPPAPSMLGLRRRNL